MGAWLQVLFASWVGLAIGALGGLLGLGGAELRLPFLLHAFHLSPLEAVIVNKVVSLVVVGVGLPARLGVVPGSEVWLGFGNAWALLLGSVVGAWTSAGWARKASADTLRRTMARLLLLMAALLVLEFRLGDTLSFSLPPGLLHVLGFVLGLGIGGVAAVMGVAGGELLIPTLVLLYNANPKLAGSLSLFISLPTMLAALAQYRQDRAFAILGRQRGVVFSLILASLLGSYLGGRVLLGEATEGTLLLILSLLLFLSALKLLRH